MELVHNHLLGRGLGALAQGDVGQDFRRATEDGGVAVDGGVAGAEADVVRAELAAEGHEFLIDKSLDRAGIDGAPSLGDGLEMEGGGHERFARAGGGVEDDVLLLEQFEDGRFLGGIEPEPQPFGVFEEKAQQHVVGGPLVALGDEVVECFRHRSEYPVPHQKEKPAQQQPGNDSQNNQAKEKTGPKPHQALKAARRLGRNSICAIFHLFARHTLSSQSSPLGQHKVWLL